jgi:hypothetical protein
VVCNHNLGCDDVSSSVGSIGSRRTSPAARRCAPDLPPGPTATQLTSRGRAKSARRGPHRPRRTGPRHRRSATPRAVPDVRVPSPRPRGKRPRRHPRAPLIANDNNGSIYTEMDSRDNTLTGGFAPPVALRKFCRGGGIARSGSARPAGCRRRPLEVVEIVEVIASWRHAAPAAYSLPLARPATAGASAALIGADRTSRQQLSAPGERRPRRSAPSRATSRGASSGGTEISRRSHAPSGLHYYAAPADAVNVSRCADARRRSRPEPNMVLCADTHTLGTARQRRREHGGRAGSRG